MLLLVNDFVGAVSHEHGRLKYSQRWDKPPQNEYGVSPKKAGTWPGVLCKFSLLATHLAASTDHTAFTDDLYMTTFIMLSGLEADVRIIRLQQKCIQIGLPVVQVRVQDILLCTIPEWGRCRLQQAVHFRPCRSVRASWYLLIPLLSVSSALTKVSN